MTGDANTEASDSDCCVEGNCYEPEVSIAIKETEPRIVIDPTDGKKIKAGTAGIAASLGSKGEPSVTRYGIAYSQRDGVANGGASGVAFTQGHGRSETGDGGVSIAHHYGHSICGAHGIAYSQNPGPVQLGSVNGGKCATLVIGWVKDNVSFSKTIKVGQSIDGINICENTWYTLDPNQCYRWIVSPYKP